jgi:UDP-N-acetylmuramate--alanine ligase
VNVKTLNSVYFIGIGGIGMSAIARYFHAMGVPVAGYDKTKTALTSKLEEEGIAITYADELATIDELYRGKGTTVVYTPAVPKDLKILNYYINQGNVVAKRSEMLGLITQGTFSVAVAGTHGKTTTSSIVAHLLTHSQKGCNAFLGGIASNYNSNVLLNEKSNTTVVEADEFDRSFLTLDPNIAVVTSTDADHLDIYGEHNALLDSFQMFVDKLPAGGVLILRNGLQLNHANTITYGIEEEAKVVAKNVRVENGNYVFDVDSMIRRYKGLVVGLPGRHNIENALAALIVGELLEMSEEQIREGLASFAGVKRRFERIISSEQLTYIDDYAHHPKELEMCINSVKELYPSKKITGIFQPHLYSRTKDFAPEFAKSLDLLDEAILMDIYPARELPIEGVNSEMLMSLMTLNNKSVVAADRMVEDVKSREIEVLLTLGAGDIDRLVEPLKNALTS